MPSSSRSATEEEWEATTATCSEVAVTTTVGAASLTPAPSAVSGLTEMAVVVSTKSKELVEIMRELDEYFLKAAEAGVQMSLLLEVPTSSVSGLRSTGNYYVLTFSKLLFFL